MKVTGWIAAYKELVKSWRQKPAFLKSAAFVRSHRLPGIAVAVCVVGLAAWGIVALTAAPEPPPEENGDLPPVTETGPEVGLQVGDLAPDFTLKDIDGNPVSLSDYRGKIVVLYFWASWCTQCVYDLPLVQETAGKYAAEGLQVVAVDIGESAATVRNFITREGYTFPVLLDPDSTVYEQFELETFPAAIFIDGEGIVRARKVKAQDAGGHGAAVINDFAAILAEIKGSEPGQEGPPEVSEVEVGQITHTGAVITWKTDKLSTSQVGISTPAHSYFTETDETPVTEHAITLTGLEPNTAYTFVVISADSRGNKATFEAQEGFTTLASLPTGPEEGSVAPDFELMDLEGNTVKLSDNRGSIVLVNFWISSCGACRGEMKYMESFYNRWKDEGVTILALNVYGKQRAVQLYVMAEEMTFPVLLDSEGTVAESYELEFLPTTFFIDRQGIIRYVMDDPFKSQEDIEKIIEEIEYP